MNLLITNTREEQPYLIIQCLRHVASRIIVTLDGASLAQRWAGVSPWSRHVSKRYRVPDCSADWRSGRIQRDNSDLEECYVQRIEEIGRLESIDVIFPSYDAEVYVFAKNKERLAQQGITAVVPDYDGLVRILDKSLTLQAAERMGFPIPKTFVPENDQALEKITSQSQAPWVLKPRCNAHGASIVVAENTVELQQAFTQLSELQERPLVQELVPPETKRNFYLVVSPDFTIVSLFSPQVARTRKIGPLMPCAAVISTSDIPFAEQVTALVEELGVWGGLTLQTIIDKRDGKPRLMEINPRFGHNLWYRTVLGRNEPLMLLHLALGQNPDEPPPLREGVLLLDPLSDLLHLAGRSLETSRGMIRGWFGAAKPAPSSLEEDRIGDLIKRFKEDYFDSRERLFGPFYRGWLRDPLPPLIRIVRILIKAMSRQLGIAS